MSTEIEGGKMEEIWKDIVGYEGFYQVSNLGKIKRLEGWEIRKNAKAWHPEHTLKGVKSHGYIVATLTKDGKGKIFRVHRLVAEAFIPNPNNLPVINHKDRNKQNNCVDNLEWCTQQHNIRDASDKGSFDKYKQPIRDIETGIIYPSIKECAIQLGLNPKNLSRVMNGRGNSCGGHRFERIRRD